MLHLHSNFIFKFPFVSPLKPPSEKSISCKFLSHKTVSAHGHPAGFPIGQQAQKKADA